MAEEQMAGIVLRDRRDPAVLALCLGEYLVQGTTRVAKQPPGTSYPQMAGTALTQRLTATRIQLGLTFRRQSGELTVVPYPDSPISPARREQR